MKLEEFLQIEGKKIILSNKVSNGNACIRICNIRKGIDTLNVKTMKVEDIVVELCQAYCAISEEEMPDVIDDRLSEILLNKVLMDGSYTCFPKKSLSKFTVSKLKEVTDELRKNIRTNAFEQSIDPKIRELRTMILEYEKLLKEEKLADYPLLLDHAIWILEKGKLDIDMLLPWTKEVHFGDLENNIWYTKERLVLQKLLSVCKNASFDELVYLNDDTSNHGKISFDFYRAYGIANEISQAIRGIEQSSDTAIYYSDPVYVNFLRAALDQARIPYTFSKGIKAVDTDTVQFLKGILLMAEEDFLYARLEDVINNRLMTFYNVATDEVMLNPMKAYRDSLRDGIGWGYDRILSWCTDNKNDERPLRRVYVSFLTELLDVFIDLEKGVENSVVEIYQRLLNFMRKYTYASNKEWIKLKSSLEAEIPRLSYFNEAKWSLSEKVNYLSEMLDELIISDTEGSDGVVLAPMNSFFVIERKNVFLIGLAASVFQLDTKQSPILSDEEKIKYILNANETVDLSTNRNARRKKAVVDALKTMDEGRVTMIYSSYDTIALRENSKSVFFLEMSDNQEVKQADGYDFVKEDLLFDAAKMRDVLDRVDEFVERKPVPQREWETPQNTPMSASGMQTLLGCPLAYYYQYMNYLTVYDELEKNGYEWLSAAAKGNLCHRTLEKYFESAFPPAGKLQSNVDEALFDQIFMEQIEIAKKEQPYPSVIIEQKEEQLYRKLIHTYLEKLHREWEQAKNEGKEWKIIGCELGFDSLPYISNLEDRYNFILMLRGSIDRMDGYVDMEGNLNIRIIDYKTGRKKKKAEEVEEGIQIQHYIYAYAALDYVKKHIREIQEMFSVPEIKDILFEQVAYSFPYEKPSKEEKYDEIDVTELVNERILSGTDWMEKTLLLPENISEALSDTIGALQNGRPDDFSRNCQKMIDRKRDAFEEQSLVKFCDSNYCRYKSICREWL